MKTYKIIFHYHKTSESFTFKADKKPKTDIDIIWLSAKLNNDGHQKLGRSNNVTISEVDYELS